ncbi:hypothetical protein E2562_032939 [Oryza meyeriana var. granulata]|uniref:CASP-like protein n=1 Tax=Oryza meyeriana var. granulata TaxID=110450 RepID=A0A6G1DR68_9ORYZ|nr:hypothetical protein E2562_032939 [Oryza meyeriana var. granulata]
MEPTGIEGETKAEAMRTPALLLLVVVADLFGTTLARWSARVVGKKQWESDYFVLSLQWPGTIFASIRHCCATNGCCR